ncbi:MAG: quinolinate synthase NadA [bacterium]|nr:quinolinate synthase NadA [bacterium]
MTIVSKINQLKREKNAVILVHNYQRPEIYDVADFIGDSLGLCLEAAKTDAQLIVFCGVLFMAESAAILNPGRRVIVPNIDAGCAMADMIDADKLKAFKKKHPDAAVVTYVNSTAEVKAVSDICCTSSNAIKIVKSLPQKKIIFVPDKNLAAYVASKCPEKEIIAWKGYCPVHHYVNKEYIDEIKAEHPNAKIIAHPESKPEVLEVADYISSTSGMIDCAKNDPSDEFFVLTECGMTERLHREIPGKKFHGLCNMCFDMKKNTLESILDSLETERTVVRVDDKIARRARKTFDNMFAVT